MRGMRKAVPTHDLLALAHHTLERRIDQALAEHGFPDLTLSLASNVLRFVEPGGRRLSEVVDLAPVSKQAVSRQIDVLTRAGYLVVDVDPTDGRGRLVHLTERGHRAHRAVLTIFATVEETLTEDLGEPRLEQLRSTLATLAHDRDRPSPASAGPVGPRPGGRGGAAQDVI